MRFRDLVLIMHIFTLYNILKRIRSCVADFILVVVLTGVFQCRCGQNSFAGYTLVYTMARFLWPFQRAPYNINAIRYLRRDWISGRSLENFFGDTIHSNSMKNRKKIVCQCFFPWNKPESELNLITLAKSTDSDFNTLNLKEFLNCQVYSVFTRVSFSIENMKIS